MRWIALALAAEGLVEVDRDDRCVYQNAPVGVTVVASCRLDAPAEAVDALAGCWGEHARLFPASLVASDVLARPAADRWVVRQQQPMPFPFTDRAAVIEVRHWTEAGCYRWSWELVPNPPAAAVAGFVVPAVDAGGWVICPDGSGSTARYELHYDPRLLGVPEGVLRSQTTSAIRRFVADFRAHLAAGTPCP